MLSLHAASIAAFIRTNRRVALSDADFAKGLPLCPFFPASFVHHLTPRLATGSLLNSIGHALLQTFDADIRAITLTSAHFSLPQNGWEGMTNTRSTPVFLNPEAVSLLVRQQTIRALRQLLFLHFPEPWMWLGQTLNRKNTLESLPLLTHTLTPLNSGHAHLAVQRLRLDIAGMDLSTS